MEITVVAPVYQVENYIDRFLKSIDSQTLNDFEMLLIDDGSWDDSPCICDEYLMNNSEAITFHKKNGGASTARNIGIDYSFMSENKWLAFLDSDDWIHKDYFKLLYDAVQTNGAQISMCNAVRTEDATYSFEENTNIICEAKTPEELWCKDRTLCVVPWGKLFDKTLFKNIRFPEGVIQEDEAVSYLVLFGTKKISFFEDDLYVYFQTPSSVMRDVWSPKFLSGLDSLEKQVEFFKKNGYYNAMRESANTYLYFLKAYSKTAKKSGYGEYCTVLKTRLRNGIKYYRKELELPVEGNEWVYALAYPVEMKVYFVFRKIKRVFKK